MYPISPMMSEYILGLITDQFPDLHHAHVEFEVRPIVFLVLPVALHPLHLQRICLRQRSFCRRSSTTLGHTLGQSLGKPSLPVAATMIPATNPSPSRIPPQGASPGTEARVIEGQTVSVVPSTEFTSSIFFSHAHVSEPNGTLALSRGAAPDFGPNVTPLHNKL